MDRYSSGKTAVRQSFVPSLPSTSAERPPRPSPAFAIDYPLPPYKVGQLCHPTLTGHPRRPDRMTVLTLLAISRVHRPLEPSRRLAPPTDPTSPSNYQRAQWLL